MPTLTSPTNKIIKVRVVASIRDVRAFAGALPSRSICNDRNMRLMRLYAVFHDSPPNETEASSTVKLRLLMS